MKRKWLLIANGLMTVVFVLCVAVQYNDPDPIRWMTIYGAAALACILWFRGRLIREISGGIALIAMVWAATLVPDFIGKELPPRQVFGTMHMITEAVEEAREFLGLMIVALWMLVLTFATKRSMLKPS